MSNEVYIVSAARTPVGSFLGALSEIPAPRLGAVAIRQALDSAGVPREKIDECIMGEVLTSGVGQAPARQAAIFADLPTSVRCTTVGKVCGSGLKSVMLGADSIMLGHSQVVVAGGQESMSLAPHLLQKSRSGYRMGSQTVADSMVLDGLWDPYNQFHMGSAAEICAREHRFTRSEQDEFAINSYKKAQKAQEMGWLKNEMAPVEVKTKSGSVHIDTDEEPGKARFDKMAALKPAFDKDGTITAANASKINDGAAAVVLASKSQVDEMRLKPMARIVSYAGFAQDPKWFTTAPAGAIRKALSKAQMEVSQIDFWEINEAFSLVTMAAMRELKIQEERVNVHGGAVAFGHPIGASGARILTTLLHALKTHGKRFGLATLCIGGGEAVAMIVENV